MSCRACQSENQGNFGSEINLHFPGLKGLDKPAVMVFPRLVVCLDCGYTEFRIAQAELGRIAQGSGEKGAVA